MSRTYDHGGNILAIARQNGQSPDDLLDFSASINPLGLPAAVRTALVGALDRLVHYPDSDHTELKQALARYHGVTPANLAIANGSTELLYHLPSLLHGTRALVISPAFSEYTHSLVQHHWQVIPFPLAPDQDFHIDLPALAEELARGYGALYLCNPGNPTGRLYSLETITAIRELCRENRTFLMLDEAFMDFCEEHSAKRLLCTTPDGVIIRSMTKFFGFPGLRLGYAIGHDALIERLQARGGPWNVNTLAQVAGIAAVTDHDFICRTNEYIARERQRLTGLLGNLPGLRPFSSQANFLLVKLDEAVSDAPTLGAQLCRDGILIRDCSNFVGLSRRFFRVAIRTPLENDRLVAALARILANKG